MGATWPLRELIERHLLERRGHEWLYYSVMSVSPRLRVVVAEPPELIVYDEPGQCSYIAGETWRLPLRLPVRMLSGDEFGIRLEQGDRRQGRLLYRTACPQCRACEPIRLETSLFRPNKTQRRVLRKGDAQIQMEFGAVEVDDERVALYNKHKSERDLSSGESGASIDAYRSFLGETCCDSFELRYRVDGELLGIALMDRGDDALSAVYFYWDPKFAHLNPGTYSVLKQLELCKRMGLAHLYLGLYIAQCKSMAYKGRYLPHERLIDGMWQRFDRRATEDAKAYEEPTFR
jgi:arginyl-tRNA--protein-N-Asp/Glu arginylyltransferase